MTVTSFLCNYITHSRGFYPTRLQVRNTMWAQVSSCMYRCKHAFDGLGPHVDLIARLVLRGVMGQILPHMPTDPEYCVVVTFWCKSSNSSACNTFLCYDFLFQWIYAVCRIIPALLCRNQSGRDAAGICFSLLRDDSLHISVTCYHQHFVLTCLFYVHH